MQVYISGALQASKDLQSARELYEFANDVVKRSGASPYLPHAKTDPVKHANAPPLDVFVTDFNCLIKSSAVIAFLNEPSLGVGAELAIAIERGIPVLALYQSGTSVSRFAQGYLEHVALTAKPYADREEVVDLITNFLRGLHKRGELRIAV